MRATVRLVDRIQALEHELQALRQAQHAELLAAIVLAVGARVFSAGEIRAHARLHAGLRAVLVDQALTGARRLAKRLQALNGDTYGGLRLERVGRDHQVGTLWIVRVDCPTET